MSFAPRGAGLPCPPLSVFSAPFYSVCPLCLWWLVVVGGCMHGIGVSAGAGCYCDTWRAYLNRFSPAPSSQCRRCTLIGCAGTRDPRIQRWMAHNKVIAILLLTYPHVFEYGCFQLVARWLDKLFKIAFASTPSSPSPKAKKGEKFWRCSRHASKYIRFFPLSASCRHFSGALAIWDLASVFTIRMSWTLFVPFCQRSRISRSPFCFVTSGGGAPVWSVVPLAPTGVDFSSSRRNLIIWGGCHARVRGWRLCLPGLRPHHGTHCDAP